MKYQKDSPGCHPSLCVYPVMSAISVYSSQVRGNFSTQMVNRPGELKFSSVLLTEMWSFSKSVSFYSMKEADTFLAMLKG